MYISDHYASYSLNCMTITNQTKPAKPQIAEQCRQYLVFKRKIPFASFPFADFWKIILLKRESRDCAKKKCRSILNDRVGRDKINPSDQNVHFETRLFLPCQSTVQCVTRTEHLQYSEMVAQQMTQGPILYNFPAPVQLQCSSH